MSHCASAYERGRSFIALNLFIKDRKMKYEATITIKNMNTDTGMIMRKSRFDVNETMNDKRSSIMREMKQTDQKIVVAVRIKYMENNIAEKYSITARCRIINTGTSQLGKLVTNMQRKPKKKKNI